MKKINLSWIFIVLVGLLLLDYYKNDIKDFIIDNKVLINEEKIEYYSYNDNQEYKTGNEYRFDSKYYIYYSYLSIEEKSLYRQLYANVLEYNEIIKPNVKISVDQIKTVIESLYNDHPELFYLDTNYLYKYDNNNNCIEITLKYNDLIKNIDYNKKVFYEKIDTIVNKALKYKTDYEKEKYVYKYLVNNITYDTNALYNQSSYSALVLGKSVCAGYSRAFQLIMQKLQIPTYYVLGFAKEDHAWNIVKLGDEYYNVDLTWDDTGKLYSHFNVKDKDINNTHTRIGMSIYLPKCNYNTYYKYG